MAFWLSPSRSLLWRSELHLLTSPPFPGDSGLLNCRSLEQGADSKCEGPDSANLGCCTESTFQVKTQVMSMQAVSVPHGQTLLRWIGWRVRMSLEKLNAMMLTNAWQVALLEQEAWSRMEVVRTEKRFPQRIFVTFQYRIMSFSG